MRTCRAAAGFVLAALVFLFHGDATAQYGSVGRQECESGAFLVGHLEAPYAAVEPSDDDF